MKGLFFIKHLHMCSLTVSCKWLSFRFTGEPGSKYWNHFSQLFLKADYHGAHLKVVRSTCSSLVGHSGIVIFDTKNTFKIIGRDNIVRSKC